MTALFKKVSPDEATALNGLRFLKKYPGGGRLNIRVKAPEGKEEKKKVIVEAIIKMGEIEVE